MDKDQQLLMDERRLHDQRKQGRRGIQVRAMDRIGSRKDDRDSGYGGRVETNGEGG